MSPTLYQIFEEELAPTLLKLFHKIETEAIIDGVLCLIEALKFHEVPFIIDLSAWTIGLQEVIFCANIFKAVAHFLLLFYFQFYIVVFDPLGLEFCAEL